MRFRSARSEARFQWSLFRGRCRRNLLAGLLLLIVSAGYGAWAGLRLGTRGSDAAGAFDGPVVRAAMRLTQPPRHLGSIAPANDRELYLTALVADQHDTLFGVTLLILRMVLAATVAGLGLVLTTAGATEWEIRSEYVTPAEPPPA